MWIRWLVFLVTLTGSALAHDAPPTPERPLGWSYPNDCCSGIDCEPVRDEDVLERPVGYVIRMTGEIIPMGDKRIKFSPDNNFHWCRHLQGAEYNKTICLFVPPRSY